MQSDKRIFDDLSKFLNGVAGTVAGMGREAEAGFRERTREWVAGMDLVSREEFDAVKQMAATARAEAEELKSRVAALEASLSSASPKPVAPRKKAAPRG
jgi:BMFP domain-containing protein YqiC